MAQTPSDTHHRSLIVHHPGFLDYDFGSFHPLRPERIVLGLDLLEKAGLWNVASETLRPEPAGETELTLVHDPAYVRAVAEGSNDPSRSGLASFGLSSGDNPAFAGMHEAASLVVGGTIAAVRQIMNGSLAHAFNPSGGWHHALRARASGFCIYNDPAAAAAVIKTEYGGCVLYVDFDCHHGDGVQWIFFDDPDVLTISFHESGRFLFPGTGDVSEVGEGAGKGFAVNLPFQPYTQDESWLNAVRTVLPPLAERFRPDIIISAHGADTHAWDPLTHLSLSTFAFREQARLVHLLAHEYCGGRWLAVGSGGYEWRRVVPRSWAILWAEMTGRALPAELPASWLERWAPLAGPPLPTTYQDVELAPAPGGTRDVNRQTIEAVLRLHRLAA